MRTIVIPARFDQLETIRGFAAQAARDAGMDDADVYVVEMAVDEACSNIVEHAYRGKEGGDIECTCSSDEDGLTITLRDHGEPFEPATIFTPDLGAGLYTRRVGGLGIFLIRKLMDDVRFEALGKAGNLLTMIKRRRREE